MDGCDAMRLLWSGLVLVCFALPLLCCAGKTGRALAERMSERANEQNWAGLGWTWLGSMGLQLDIQLNTQLYIQLSIQLNIHLHTPTQTPTNTHPHPHTHTLHLHLHDHHQHPPSLPIHSKVSVCSVAPETEIETVPSASLLFTPRQTIRALTLDPCPLHSPMSTAISDD